MSEIIKHQDFIESIKAKVKQEFINLIPENKWEQFIGETMKEFQEKELKGIIKKELEEHSKKVINDYLNEKTANSWDSKRNKNILDEATKNMVIAAAPQMLAEVFEVVIMNTMQRMRNGY